MAATREPSSKLHLFDLPAELLLAIISHVPSTSATTASAAAQTYTSLFALRWSSRTLHALTPNPKPYATRASEASDLATNSVDANACRAEWLAALLALENWPAYTALPPLLRTPLHADNPADRTRNEDDGTASRIPPQSRHACHVCMRLRRSSTFVVASQLSGARAKRAHGAAHNAAAVPSVLSGADVLDPGIGAKAGARFCIRCGVDTGFYTARSPLLRFVIDWVGDGHFATGFVCGRCRRFAQGDADSSEALRRKCDACRRYRLP